MEFTIDQCNSLPHGEESDAGVLVTLGRRIEPNAVIHDLQDYGSCVRSQTDLDVLRRRMATRIVDRLLSDAIQHRFCWSRNRRVAAFIGDDIYDYGSCIR